jgi:hypothetical protein
VTKFWSAGLAALAFTLAGCEYLDATRGVEPPPAEGRPFPNLASVPAAPPKEPAAERKSEVEQLTASRDASIKQDQEIRALNPGAALPPPSPRAAPAAPSAAPPAAESAPTGVSPAPSPPQAAVTMPRPQIPSSLFMGTVLPTADRGPLADFQRKVLQDSAAMAQRTNGRIRLVGGRSDAERQGIVRELAGMGVAAGRIQAAPDSALPSRAGIDVIVEN